MRLLIDNERHDFVGPAKFCLEITVVLNYASGNRFSATEFTSQSKKVRVPLFGQVSLPFFREVVRKELGVRQEITLPDGRKISAV